MRSSRTRLLPRETNTRDARLCIIATEGEKTEARYFSQFQNTRVKVVVLPTDANGESSPLHVMNRLDLYREQQELGPQDSVWLMIDVDRWPKGKLAEVCQDARQRSIGLAVSNPCFELWLWLHHANALTEDETCKSVEDRLRQRLGSYSKRNLDINDFAPYVQEALRRAQTLDADATALWPAFPGTHVYKVIASLPGDAS